MQISAVPASQIGIPVTTNISAYICRVHTLPVDYFMTFKDLFHIFKDLITLWYCLELVTEIPDEMRKLKKDFFKRVTQSNFITF